MKYPYPSRGVATPIHPFARPKRAVVVVALFFYSLTLAFGGYSDIRSQVRTWEQTLAPSISPTANPTASIYSGSDFAVACDTAVKMLIYDWDPAGNATYATDARALLSLLTVPAGVAPDNGKSHLQRFLLGYRTPTETSPSGLPSTLNFFSPYPIMLAYERLDAAGLLDATFKANFKTFIYQTFTSVGVPNAHPDELNNAWFARASGYKRAAQLFADDGTNSSLHAYWSATLPSAIWSKLTNTGAGAPGLFDIPEDSSQYIGITHAYAWVLADCLGQTATLNHTMFRSMVDRLRDQVTPSGQFVTYGDSFDANPDTTGANSDNWPVLLDWGYHVYAFERSGTAFSEATYRWAATQMAETGFVREPFDRHIRYIMPMMFLALADGVRNTALIPSQPVASSTFQERNYQHAPPPATVTSNYFETDKIILNPSRASGQSFALLSLFPPHGYHGHYNQPGSIAYFQNGNRVLLHSLDGNMRGAENSNLLLIKPAGQQFPVRAPSFSIGTQFNTEFPLRNIRFLGDENVRTISTLGLRVAVPPGATGKLTVDFLRLVGTGSPQLVDAFDATTGWSLPSGVSAAVVGSMTQGTGAVEFTFVNSDPANTKAFVCQKSFAVTNLSLAQFAAFSMDWKVTGSVNTARPFIFRVMSQTDANGLGTYDTDFYAQETQLAADLTDSANRATSAGYHFADVRYAQWFTVDTTLRRRVVMDPQGVLLVRDDLAPGAQAAGRTGGSVWNIAGTGAPEFGTQWVDSVGAAGTDRDLFVWVNRPSGRLASFQTLAGVGSARLNQRVVYTQQSLSSGVPLRFVSALIPHDPVLPGATLASGLSVNEPVPATGASGRTELTYQLDGQTRRSFIDVLNDNGTSSVVEIGDSQGIATFIARSPDNALQSQAPARFVTDGRDVQLDYRPAVSTTAPLYWDAVALKQLQLSTQALFTATNFIDVLKMDFAALMPVTGTIAPTTSATTVALYSPVSTYAVRVDGAVVPSTYDALAKTRTFTLVAGPANRRIALADPDLVLHWPFDEFAGGTTIDPVGGRSGAMLNGLSVTGAAGRFGSSLAFDGVDDAVRHDNAASPTLTGYPFTLSAWVKTSQMADAVIAMTGQGSSNSVHWYIGMYAGAANIVARNTTKVEKRDTLAINDGVWHHVVGVFASATSRQLYVDGVLRQSDSSSVAFGGTERFAVGALDRATPAARFAGSIDDVRVYRRALTQAEILALEY